MTSLKKDPRDLDGCEDLRDVGHIILGEESQPRVWCHACGRKRHHTHKHKVRKPSPVKRKPLLVEGEPYVLGPGRAFRLELTLYEKLSRRKINGLLSRVDLGWTTVQAEGIAQAWQENRPVLTNQTTGLTLQNVLWQARIESLLVGRFV